MRKLFRNALFLGAIAAAPLPLSARPAEVKAGMADDGGFADFFEMFTGLYDTSDLEPVDPAQLALATVTAEKLIPEGAYADMMVGMMNDMLSPLFGGTNALSDMQIMFATGVDAEAIDALDEAAKAEILDLLDPARQQRAEAMQSAIMPALTTVMAQMEGPMREGIAKAYARRLSAEELTDINAFLATPTGTKYARETFQVYADPEVMQASMEAMPEMVGSIFADGGAWQAEIDAMPKERQLTDLSDDELKQLAGILNVDLAALEAHRTLQAGPVYNDDFAVASDEYDDPADWSPADRALVEQMEAEAEAALQRYYDAQMQAAANAGAQSN